MAWVQLDQANAFGQVSRTAVLAALEEHAPELVPFASLFLRRRSSFIYVNEQGRGELLGAVEGVEQGDPLGPLL